MNNPNHPDDSDTPQSPPPPPPSDLPPGTKVYRMVCNVSIPEGGEYAVCARGIDSPQELWGVLFQAGAVGRHLFLVETYGVERDPATLSVNGKSTSEV